MTSFNPEGASPPNRPSALTHSAVSSRPDRVVLATRPKIGAGYMTAPGIICRMEGTPVTAPEAAQSWPGYLVDRACQAPPEGSFVVPGSTPVVAFGNPVRPAVATLGINPSRAEFLDRNGGLLCGRRRS